MHWRLVSSVVCFSLLGSSLSLAGDMEAMIASAESAGPASVTDKATIKAPDGTVLRQGSNSYTCYPQQDIIGPMCNEKTWDALISAMEKWIFPDLGIVLEICASDTIFAVLKKRPDHKSESSAPFSIGLAP